MNSAEAKRDVVEKLAAKIASGWNPAAAIGNALAIAYGLLIGLTIPGGTRINHGEAMMAPIGGIALLTLGVGVPFAIVQIIRCGGRGWLGLALCFLPLPAFALIVNVLFVLKGVTP